MLQEQVLPFILKVGTIHSYSVQAENDEVKEKRRARGTPLEAWRSCFRHHDGAIYLANQQVSRDGGRTFVPHHNEGLEPISVFHIQQYAGSPGPEGSVFSKPGYFLALSGYSRLVEPGIYHTKMWRSTDELQTIEEGEAVLRIPDGYREKREGWHGIFISRNIVEMPDGSLLATANGHFESDRIVPRTGSGQRETTFLLRTFVMSSQDKGETWDYLATVAVPKESDPVAEGFNEPTMALLDNGELLCIMRTGHQSPLYSSRSRDGGKTWSTPLYTGLERGCWPCLIKLADGRLALSFGNRFPPGWSHIGEPDDHTRFSHPGAGIVKLAISPDGTGETWMQTTIATEKGSVYSTMFETEPNILFVQVDGWYWRVQLMPRIIEDL